jgi:hypothetical protein
LAQMKGAGSIPILELYMQNFWLLGNLITGLAIIQALVIILAIEMSPRLKVEVSRHPWVAMGLTIAAYAAYGSMVWWFHGLEIRILLISVRAQQLVGIVFLLAQIEVTAVALSAMLLLVIIWRTRRKNRSVTVEPEASLEPASTGATPL